MEVKDLQNILREMRFTQAMSPATLEQLASLAEPELVNAGTVLFREGSENTDLYLVRDGKIALEINVPGRGRIRMLTVGPGEFVGWFGLLGNGRMTATAVALEDTQVLKTPCDKLNELCDSDHRFCHHLMKSMALALGQRLVATRLQLLDLFASDQPS